MVKRTKAPRTASNRSRRMSRKSSEATPSVPSSGGPGTAALTVSSGVAPTRAKVKMRFYCQGIGDCHLLKFPKDAGGDFWMLIDCGIHSSIAGGTEKIKAIVDDIASVTKRLDVIVLTHEHWDHVSGFLLAESKFKDLDVGEVWMAWTENPDDPQARQLDKFKGGALMTLHQASEQLDQVTELGPHLSAVQHGLQALLGFNFGAKGERVRSARDAAIGLTKRSDVKYLEPKSPPISPLGIAKSVRIYVLGPPRDAAMLGLTERQSEMYGLGVAGGWPIAQALGNAFAINKGILLTGDDATAPFDTPEGSDLSVVRSGKAASSTNKEVRTAAQFVHNFYDGPAERSPTAKTRLEQHTSDPNEVDQSWRRIDHDWLGVSADLAMQLDDRTNNSSLVLAFEFLDTKRVMLFVGDAQVGNWLSWQNVSWSNDDTTVSDLLARTIFYKVGHHGSQNATLKQHGLELMTSPDLSAFIPTNEKDALKVKWGEMPFKTILEDLQKRTSQRVIRADDPWIGQPASKPKFGLPSGAVLALQHDEKKGLWVELDIA
jgi:Metallo-beta-lactamase superfamily